MELDFDALNKEVKRLMEEVRKKKQGAIDSLLAERAEIDRKLSELEYTEVVKKKRHRRTKAEIEAARKVS